ncbi:type II/IV secretion system ATPase subunit, partial [Candidatus Woesearchaeota archaeon]|nr:type II/IV secretion system ATPase subunit [Candidatus Woesearchaeota archaeon]
MALFKKEMFSYDILREGEEIILKVDCEAYTKVPSLADDPVVMSKVIEFIAEVGNVTKIVLSQKRNYEYEFSQTILLQEIAMAYKQIMRNKDIYSYNALVSDPKCTKCLAGWYAELRHIVSDLLKSDPIGAYVELRRIMRREKLKADRIGDVRCKKCENNFINILNYMIDLLDKTRLITLIKDDIAGYKLGDRSLYARIFSPVIKPDFLFTKLMASYPPEGEELDSYSVEGSEVTIFSVPETILYLYHVTPPEFRLSEDRYEILDAARKIMAEHKPKRSEFTDPARMREVFFNVGRDLIEELIGHKKIRMSEKDVDQLTSILVRYTVGFGLIEVLLQDEKVQDVSINPPMGQIPIFIVQQDFGDCKTNVIPTTPEAESWASKLRMISGRPLDEANPILDTEITIPGASARVSTLTQPLSPNGLAYSFRRHRDRPWTLPLFIKNRMVSPLASGLLSFLIDGTRTFFICGTRGSGKTSFLSSCMIELMRRSRVITIEDTLELPFESFKKLGYNFVQMKVASALAKESSEYTATEGIRSTLRLGDSSIFVGEVRSKEAVALFEAMRVGAGSNMVGGTFHADSPYGVFDRCVNAIGIPRTSFKALDCCIIANPIRSADGMHMWRRVLQITEVRKTWSEDPMTEGGFVDLMKYQSGTDQLEPTNDLINGESEIIKSIAGNIKEWAGNWDAVWENINLRADCKTAVVDLADKAKNPELLEAEFVI